MAENQYFLTAIDTNAGKTFCAALLTHSLGADYWKPIQAGELDNTDSMKVGQLAGLTGQQILPERHRLTEAMSPHAAAARESKEIKLGDFRLPSKKALIVEGAGGIHAPINERETILDVMRQLDLPVIVVIKHYLGSINHSTLTLDTLKQNKLNIAGIIFNGLPNAESERFILTRHPVKAVLHLAEFESINHELIAALSASEEVQNFQKNLRSRG